MGVYLSEINMPKGEGSKLVLQIFPNGEVYDEHGIRLGITNWAEAVHVPPHGRLIDEQWIKDAMITTLEALKKNPKMNKQEMHLIAAFDTLRVMVEDAPTIIPAEEGET